MNAKQIVAALGGQWRGDHGDAHCPAHDDNRRSLSVTEGEGGILLVKCHAKCTQDAVIGALRAKALWPEHEAREFAAIYDYCAADGALVYQVCRKMPKAFVQRRPDGRGGWIWNLKGVKSLPYRLPALLLADPNGWVFISEGEKDCDNLVRLGMSASCNSGGAGKWSQGISEHFSGRKVAILPDNDDAGRAHAQDVAKKLHGIAFSVRVLALPGLPPKGDVSDWVSEGGTADELRRLAEEAPEWRPGNGLDDDSHADAAQNACPDDSRPLIRVVDSELPQVVNEVEDALIAIGGIYERSGQLIRPVRIRVPAADDRQTTSHRLAPITAAHVAEAATRAAKFEKYDPRAGKWRPIACPPKIAETFLARLEWRLPVLVGITSAPMLRPDGSLLDRPGYDVRTCLLFDPGDTAFPPIPDHPTIEQARAALGILADLLSEFSFAGIADKAIALAAVLTALVRRSLSAAPMFGVTAPDFGYGKTYLVDVVSAIGSGGICPVTAQGERPEELDKHLAAALNSPLRKC